MHDPGAEFHNKLCVYVQPSSRQGLAAAHTVAVQVAISAAPVGCSRGMQGGCRVFGKLTNGPLPTPGVR